MAIVTYVVKTDDGKEYEVDVEMSDAHAALAKSGLTPGPGGEKPVVPGLEHTPATLFQRNIDTSELPKGDLTQNFVNAANPMNMVRGVVASGKEYINRPNERKKAADAGHALVQKGQGSRTDAAVEEGMN